MNHDGHLSLPLPQRHQDRVDLLQFTDTHIYPRPDQRFDGVDTGASLMQVIAHARKFHWPADAILVTGDLVHEPEQAAYERIHAILEAIALPVFCIPGNHDEPALMRRVLETGRTRMASMLVFRCWIVVMLDSFLPGTHAGRLGKKELGYLERALTEHNEKNALVCLHHPPVSVGSPWMDRMGLQNPDELFSVTDRHPRVRGILWGHIHQEFNQVRNNVQLMASPSTCVQFMPCSGSYVRDDAAPGYRRLQLLDSGAILGGIERIG